VFQLGEHLRFLEEHIYGFGADPRSERQLDRDFPSELFVERKVDFAEPTSSEKFSDQKSAQFLWYWVLEGLCSW
jgi:hypothetical protein